MTQIWQSIAYLDPDTGQPFCGWCQKFGHGIENCPQLVVCNSATNEGGGCMKKLGYEYRPDGNFLIRKTCAYCKEEFDVHAMSPVTPESAYGLCPACEAVAEMEQKEIRAKLAAEQAVERLRITDIEPGFSVEAERERKSFRIAWITFWLTCGAAILAVIWRLTR